MDPALFRPQSNAEVAIIKAEYGSDAVLVAGGQSVSLLIHHGFVRPGIMVSLSECVGAERVIDHGSCIELGNMVTSQCVSALHHMGVGALIDACRNVASPHVRTLGTVAGSLCHAEPGSDAPVALSAMGASVRVSGSKGDLRDISIDDLIVGPFSTSIEDDEFVDSIWVPKSNNWRWWYKKFSIRSFDLALANLAFGIQIDDSGIIAARVSVGGVAPVPTRLRKFEAALESVNVDELGSNQNYLHHEAIGEMEDLFEGRGERVRYGLDCLNGAIHEILDELSSKNA